MPCASMRSDLAVFTRIHGLKFSWRLHRISVTFITLVHLKCMQDRLEVNFYCIWDSNKVILYTFISRIYVENDCWEYQSIFCKFVKERSFLRTFVNSFQYTWIKYIIDNFCYIWEKLRSHCISITSIFINLV